jgi:hypothetical protein
MYSLPITMLEIVNPELQCVLIAMEDPWFCKAPTINDLTKESLETHMKTSILQLVTTTYYKQNSIASGWHKMQGLVHCWQGETRKREALRYKQRKSLVKQTPSLQMSYSKGLGWDLSKINDCHRCILTTMTKGLRFRLVNPNRWRKPFHLSSFVHVHFITKII